MRSLALVFLGTLIAAAPAWAQAPLKVMNYARIGQFETLDPQRQFDDASIQLVRLTYNSLLSYSYLDRPYKLTNDLLARMPALSADKLSYTLTLRTGLRFHDNACFPGGKGREVTADDVIYSLRRFADPFINHKSWSLMEGAVVGLDAYREAVRQAGATADRSKLEVAGLRKVDSHTLTVQLTRPNPLFLFSLAISPTSIVPVEAVQFYKEQFSVNPVGTGPFMLKNVERKGVLRFEKNANYHGVYPSAGAPGDAEKGLLKDAGKRLPLVDVIEMPLIEEAQPAALKFLKGELDWRSVDRANFTKMVVRTPDGGFKLNGEFAARYSIFWTPGLDTAYIGINMKDPLLGKNKALRQALAHLVDTPGRIEVLLGGRGRKLHSIVPYELPGSERETGARFREYDVAEARRLLAEAGFPEGKGLPPISLSFGFTDADTRNTFDFMRAKAAAAGVQLKGVFSDNPSFIKAIEGGNFQLASYGWIADFADAENFYQLLASRNTAPGPNFPAFSNTAYDKAYDAARLMPNGPERLALFKTLNDIVRDEVPVILLVNSLRFGVQQKWLRNFKRNLLEQEFPYLDIDMALKKKSVN